jgi:hypothetical protein
MYITVYDIINIGTATALVVNGVLGKVGQVNRVWDNVYPYLQ